MVMHAFNPSTREVEASGFLSSRPAWSTKWVPGQPGLYRETLSRKSQKKKILFPAEGPWGVAPTSASKEDTTWSDSSQQPLLQEHLDAATGTGHPGRAAYIHPSTGEGSMAPQDWSVCLHLICMYLLRRGQASTCAMVLFTTKAHRKPAPS
jgi:hypothetical protein